MGDNLRHLRHLRQNSSLISGLRSEYHLSTMGGCQSSQSTQAAPLRRKGDLLEAESKPYLATEQKTSKKSEQFWVDPKELDAENASAPKPRIKNKSKGREQGGTKEVIVDDLVSTKEDIGKSKAKPETRQEARANTSTEKCSTFKTSSNTSSTITTIPEVKASTTSITDDKPVAIESSIPAPVESNSALSTLKKRICPSYAVVFDEKKEATKLVHWKTYEKVHLPGFLEEREKYLGMIKQMKMKKQMSTAVESVATRAETATPASKTVEAIKNVSAPSIAPPEDPVEQPGMASIAPAPSKAKPFTADSELPQGPLALLYDAENQYVKLISWDEYAEKFQHKDVAEWGKM